MGCPEKSTWPTAHMQPGLQMFVIITSPHPDYEALLPLRYPTHSWLPPEAPVAHQPPATFTTTVFSRIPSSPLLSSMPSPLLHALSSSPPAIGLLQTTAFLGVDARSQAPQCPRAPCTLCSIPFIISLFVRLSAAISHWLGSQSNEMPHVHFSWALSDAEKEPRKCFNK